MAASCTCLRAARWPHTLHPSSAPVSHHQQCAVKCQGLVRAPFLVWVQVKSGFERCLGGGPASVSDPELMTLMYLSLACVTLLMGKFPHWLKLSYP